ncbi:MAG: AarF/UbiB family protein, partial [Chloroflexota bacterium]
MPQTPSSNTRQMQQRVRDSLQTYQRQIARNNGNGHHHNGNGAGNGLPGGPLMEERLAAYKQAREANARQPTYFGPPPMTQTARQTATRWQIIARLGIWIRSLWYFFSGRAWDTIRRRRTEAREAARLREALELAGGTLVKIGQQMSIRMDILPYRYCYELAQMLDDAPVFPFEQTKAILEEAYGRRWDEVFSEINPEPVGSASVAVVYRGVLRETGEAVAIKVRRPNIEIQFDADLKILAGLMQFAEWLTVVAPDQTANVRKELYTMFIEELDFRSEDR